MECGLEILCINCYNLGQSSYLRGVIMESEISTIMHKHACMLCYIVYYYTNPTQAILIQC
jgi:hypothetical protein